MSEHEFVDPMLISEIPGYIEKIMSQSLIHGQPKLNGWCCMANTVTRKIYTRNGNEITNLPYINAALPKEGPEWIHGEIYRHGKSLDQIQSLIKRGKGGLQFHVFDVVTGERTGIRMTRVLKLETNHIVHTVATVPMPVSSISEFYEGCLKAGYEGAIVRLEDYGYFHGRSRHAFKLKPGIQVI